MHTYMPTLFVCIQSSSTSAFFAPPLLPAIFFGCITKPKSALCFMASSGAPRPALLTHSALIVSYWTLWPSQQPFSFHICNKKKRSDVYSLGAGSFRTRAALEADQSGVVPPLQNRDQPGPIKAGQKGLKRQPECVNRDIVVPHNAPTGRCLPGDIFNGTLQIQMSGQ